MVANEKTTKAPIAIIERNVDTFLVASDTLKAGDTVVTEGVQLLREGGTVRIRPTTGIDALPSNQDPPTAETPAPGRQADAGAAIAAPGGASAR